MKEKLKKALKITNNFLDKYLEINLTILLLYLGMVAISCLFVHMIGGQFTTFICIAIGTLLGKAVGVYTKKKGN